MSRLVSLVCVLTLGGLLAGCGADGSSSDTTAGGAAAGSAADSGSERVASSAKDAAAPAEAASAATAATRLVRTAQITVEVKNVDRAATTVRDTAEILGGIVSTEKTGLSPREDDGTDRDQYQESTITLRVPEPKMDDALTRIAGVGREQDRSTSSEDVTATIADLDSRVSTQTRSVARVRKLLDRADSLQDVVLLESELSRREADLEAVQARQRTLADKAALATITVILRTPAAVVAAADDEPGFLAGLAGGWKALKISTTAVLTVLGAVLPISVVVAAIGVPVYLVRRRFRSPTPPAPRPEPAAGPLVP